MRCVDPYTKCILAPVIVRKFFRVLESTYGARVRLKIQFRSLDFHGARTASCGCQRADNDRYILGIVVHRTHCGHSGIKPLAILKLQVPWETERK